MSPYYWRAKLPTTARRYGIDWSKELGPGDSIVSTELVVLVGDVEVGESVISPTNPTVTTYFLAGGTAGGETIFRATILTGSGETIPAIMGIAVDEELD